MMVMFRKIKNNRIDQLMEILEEVEVKLSFGLIIDMTLKKLLKLYQKIW
jgi:hypothetical protein